MTRLLPGDSLTLDLAPEDPADLLARLRAAGVAMNESAERLITDARVCAAVPERVTVVERTLTEDLTGGPPLPSAPDVAVGYDVTSAATVPGTQFGTADLVARADGVLAGLPVAARVFTRLAPGATITASAADGDRVRRGDVLLTVRGPVRALLAAER